MEFWHLSVPKSAILERFKKREKSVEAGAIYNLKIFCAKKIKGIFFWQGSEAERFNLLSKTERNQG